MQRTGSSIQMKPKQLLPLPISFLLHHDNDEDDDEDGDDIYNDRYIDDDIYNDR